MPTPLSQLQVRLARAEQHLAALETAVRDFTSLPPYDVEVEDEVAVRQLARLYQDANNQTALETAGVHVVAANVQPVPDSFAMIIGELLHNLRSALDHLAWQLAIKHSGRQPIDTSNRAKGESLTSFPILDKRPTKAGQLLLSPFTTDDIERTLDGFQPYQTSDPSSHPLAAIRDLNNTDKHRAIHATVAVNTGFRTTLDLPGGEIIGQRLRAYVYTGTVMQEMALHDGYRLGHFLLSALPTLVAEPDGRLEPKAEITVVVTLGTPGTSDKPTAPAVA